MGSVSSVPADSGAALIVRDPARFFISLISVAVPTNNNTQSSSSLATAAAAAQTSQSQSALSDRAIIGSPGSQLALPNYTNVFQTSFDLNLKTNSVDFSTKALDSKQLMEYILDPDPRGNFPFLPKLPPFSVLKFKIQVSAPQSAPINNLTLIVAPSIEALDNLLLHEFLDNPNIQNEENVVLLGDYSAPCSFEFVWKSFPSLTSPEFKHDSRGTRLIFCFAEYDKRDHSLRQLARFAVWIQNQQDPPLLPPTLPPKTLLLPKINTDRLEPLPELTEASPPPPRLSSPRLISSSSPLQIYPSDLTSRMGARSASPNISKLPATAQPSSSSSYYYPSSPDSVDHHFTFQSTTPRRGSADTYSFDPSASSHSVNAYPYSTSSSLDHDLSPIPQPQYQPPPPPPPQGPPPPPPPPPHITTTTTTTTVNTTSSQQTLINADPVNSNSTNAQTNTTTNTTAIPSSSSSSTISSHPHVVSSLILPEDSTTNLFTTTTTTAESIMETRAREKRALFIPRPRDDTILQPEDGPMFRAQIAEYERKTSTLKTKVKKFLKRALLVHERQMALIEAHMFFLESIQDTVISEALPLQTLIHYYFNNKSNSAYFNLDLLRRSAAKLQEHVIEPARKLYDQEIKTFDQRKKEFDEESREYYSWLSRYLSVKQEAKGKKKSDSDSKYIEKRRAFELRRFDYFTYLQDLHGGRKQQIVMHQLAIFAEAEVNTLINISDRIRSNNKPEIDHIANEVKSAGREWQRHREDREDQRRAIERATRDPPPTSSSHVIYADLAPSPLIESFNSNSKTSLGISAAAAAAAAISTPLSSSLSSATTSGAAATTTTTTNTTTNTNTNTIITPSATTSLHHRNASFNTISPDFDDSLFSSKFGKSTGFASSSPANTDSTISPTLFTPNTADTRMMTTPPPQQSQSSQLTGSTILSPSNQTVYDTDEQQRSTSTTLPISGGTPNSGNSSSITGSSMTNTNGISGTSINKQGLVWAMSRPGGINDQINLNKPGWHKFWVVLAGGKLCEYTNWKQGAMDLHNEPINLRMALVREARNAERRFCFEVVTPNYKRVYQATSEDDMLSWIRAINHGISSSLEDVAKSAGSSESSIPMATGVNSSGTRLSHDQSSSAYHHHHHHTSASLSHIKTDDTKRELGDFRGELAKLNVRKVSLHRRVSKGANSHEKPSSQLPPPPMPTINGNSRIVDLVRGLDSSNHYCADCGQQSKVEWISINLLVVLCIDCSGVHRSLGTHISKVRSLTLDTVSFTNDFIDLVKCVNNNLVNSIWEAKLPKPKQTTKIIENRVAFIREKYIEKKYVDMVSKPNAVLRTAVQNKDVSGILSALASRANASTPMDAEGEPESPLVYSLRMTPPGSTTFPIAELLVLNSVEGALPTVSAAAASKLSPAALLYLKNKGGTIATRAPQPAPINTAAAAATTGQSTGLTTPMTPAPKSSTSISNTPGGTSLGVSSAGLSQSNSANSNSSSYYSASNTSSMLTPIKTSGLSIVDKKINSLAPSAAALASAGTGLSSSPYQVQAQAPVANSTHAGNGEGAGGSHYGSISGGSLSSSS
ncbi:uncharacterized protein SAPINGB_P002514 [Magnusiomyces paraingens]|uniref:ADP-ribosylation factor GTPase-activating protein n=1 Tax=Magnusiomyces paraingens TaxID=2606893 RepID=A0A5E8BEK1_9ASCO|nr:uncharacterized protein SAPINGB_P002514 [Saprochaete ingens]VVT49929.1 unnamed protein product [Saprochaete ingens]